MIGGEDNYGIIRQTCGFKRFEHPAERLVDRGDRGFHIDHIRAHFGDVRQVRRHGDRIGVNLLHVMREGTMRLGKADLSEERGRVLCPLRQKMAARGCQLGATPARMGMLVAATFRAVGLMLGAEETGFVSVGGEDLGEMLLIRVQVIGESGVGQPDDAICVGVASGPEGGAGGAALGRDAEAVLELERGCGEGVRYAVCGRRGRRSSPGSGPGRGR